MESKKLLGFVALAMIALVGANYAYAQPFGPFGHSGWPGQEISEEDKAEMQAEMAEMQAHREAVTEAIESGDFEAWKSLMAEQFTEERFNSLVEVHQKMSELQELRQVLVEAREAGDDEKVEEILSELAEYRTAEGMRMPMRRGFNGKKRWGFGFKGFGFFR